MLPDRYMFFKQKIDFLAQQKYKAQKLQVSVFESED